VVVALAAMRISNIKTKSIMKIKIITCFAIVALLATGCIKTNYNDVPDMSGERYKLPANAELISIEALKGTFQLPQDAGATGGVEIPQYLDERKDSVGKIIDTVYKDY
jgi:hypothetical protein